MRSTAIILLSSLLPLLLLFLGEGTATGPSFLRRLGEAVNDFVYDGNVALHKEPLPTLKNAIQLYHADRDASTSTPLLLATQTSVLIPSKYKALDRDSWGFPTHKAVLDRALSELWPTAAKEAERRLELEVIVRTVVTHENYPRHGYPRSWNGGHLLSFDVDHPVPEERDRASIKQRSPSLTPALDAVDNIILRLNALVKEYSPALRDKVAGDLIWLNEIAEQSITKTAEDLETLKQYMSVRTKSFRGDDLDFARKGHAEVSKHAREILEASGRRSVGLDQP